MVNELCELAASGVSSFQLILFGIVLLGVGSALFTLRKKGLHVRWVLVALLFALSLTTPLQQEVFAQSAEDCPPAQANSQDPPTEESVPISGLVDDYPELITDLDLNEDPPLLYGYNSFFQVLTNDNAPTGDPFDVGTLQLLSDYKIIDEDGWETHLILDPNDQTMPDPNDYWIDNPNIWGMWYLELTCDPNDTDHCDVDMDDTAYCTDPLGNSCWPSGDVVVYLYGRAAPGNYSIQYTVNTLSGKQFIPATITVTVPEPPVPNPITALGDTFNSSSCGEWPIADFAVDLMGYVSTTGDGTLLPSSIDLDPSTPEIDKVITVYSTSVPTNYITFTVDENGIVTMTNPQGGVPGNSGDYTFLYTISDSDDFTSTPALITVSFGCA